MTIQATLLPTKLQKIRTQIHALNQQERLILFQTLVAEEPIAWSEIVEAKEAVDAAVPPELFLWEAPPIQNVAQLKADWWPQEETADDINDFVRQLRQGD